MSPTAAGCHRPRMTPLMDTHDDPPSRLGDAQRRSRWRLTRLASAVLLLSLVLSSACATQPVATPVASASSDVTASSPGPRVDRVPEEPEEIEEDVLAFLERSEGEQEAQLRTLSAEVERQMFVESGLEAALGGPDATDAAFAEVTGTMNGEVAKLREDPPEPAGFEPATFARSDDAPSIGGTLFGGFVIAILGTDAAIGATKNGESGSDTRKTDGAGTGELTFSGSRGEVAVETTAETSGKGLTEKLKTTVELQTCPDAHGEFTGKVRLEMSAVKTGTNTGQKGSMEIELTGYVDDDARVSGLDMTTHLQFAEFAGSKGGFLDVTVTVPFGSSSVPATVSENRAAGTVTDSIRTSATALAQYMGPLLGYTVADKAERGWQDGRCVKLEASASPGPKGLEPSSTSTITAAPTSKMDGGPVGGTVAGRITAGGVSVDPASSPVPADPTAQMTYTAPDAPNKSGTVALEARSRRGVGKAEIVFETGGAAYLIVGGLEDWQVSQVVCDVMQPFELSTEIGTMTLSGGLNGTYQFHGLFDAQYRGTYAITLPSAPGQPGSMIGTGDGSIAGQAGSGSENYTLTPADPC